MIELTEAMDRASRIKAKPKIWLPNAAHYQVSKALKEGRIKKEPCEVCDNEVSVAHHPDYSEPLTVVWLCHPHHMELHAAMRKS